MKRSDSFQPLEREILEAGRLTENNYPSIDLDLDTWDITYTMLEIDCFRLVLDLLCGLYISLSIF